MYFTNVSGHLMNYDFPNQYQFWKKTNIEILYKIEPVKSIDKNKQHFVKNIESLSK